jgi:hypothetical protein
MAKRTNLTPAQKIAIIREKTEEPNIAIKIHVAKEEYPEARPQFITDNAPQFIAKDFKEFVRISGMTNLRTSRHYRQSNGKIDRFHKTLKGECIRLQMPPSQDDVIRIGSKIVLEYNERRVHIALRYLTPKDLLEERQQPIFDDRDAKLEAGHIKRAKVQQTSRNNKKNELVAVEKPSYTTNSRLEDMALVGSKPSTASIWKVGDPEGYDLASYPSASLTFFDRLAKNPGGVGAGLRYSNTAFSLFSLLG